MLVDDATRAALLQLSGIPEVEAILVEEGPGPERTVITHVYTVIATLVEDIERKVYEREQVILDGLKDRPLDFHVIGLDGRELSDLWCEPGGIATCIFYRKADLQKEMFYRATLPSHLLEMLLNMANVEKPSLPHVVEFVIVDYLERFLDKPIHLTRPNR